MEMFKKSLVIIAGVTLLAGQADLFAGKPLGKKKQASVLKCLETIRIKKANAALATASQSQANEDSHVTEANNVIDPVSQANETALVIVNQPQANETNNETALVIVNQPQDNEDNNVNVIDRRNVVTRALGGISLRGVRTMIQAVVPVGAVAMYQPASEVFPVATTVANVALFAVATGSSFLAARNIVAATPVVTVLRNGLTRTMNLGHRLSEAARARLARREPAVAPRDMTTTSLAEID